MKNETKWTIDHAHSAITFKVKHLMIAHVRGSFQKFSADISTTENDFTTAVIDLWMDPNSITTGDESRDQHLKSPDFFDTANHKEISFTSSTIGKADADDNHELWGELSIKGITKNVKLNVVFGGIINDPWGNERAGFTISGKIKRTDWDLTWNNSLESGGVLVGEDIKIMCEIQLVHTRQANPTMNLEGADEKKSLA